MSEDGHAISVNETHRRRQRMEELYHHHDLEASHIMADEILCDALIELGQKDLVYAFKKLKKVYA